MTKPQKQIEEGAADPEARKNQYKADDRQDTEDDPYGEVGVFDKDGKEKKPEDQ